MSQTPGSLHDPPLRDRQIERDRQTDRQTDRKRKERWKVVKIKDEKKRLHQATVGVADSPVLTGKLGMS